MPNKFFKVVASIVILCTGLASCRIAKTTQAPFMTLPSEPTSAKIDPSDTPRSAANARLTPKPTSVPSVSNILTIGAGWQDPWVRNFNPFYYQHIWYASDCIYEPMMIYNSKAGELLPWLAVRYAWGEGNQTLTFNLRREVKWSDGKPFGAQDVVATFKMLMEHPDIGGWPESLPEFPNPISTWLNTYIRDITSPDAFTVIFRFKTVNTLGLYELAGQIIVPAHVWTRLDRPQDFENQDPVGTGPFTEVTVFESNGAEFEQVLQLERNPHYWQEDKPYIQGVRFSFRHEEQSLEDLTQGKLDWTSINIPDIQKDFLDIDPSHYQALLSTYSMSLLLLNTTRPPFDNPDVRKAISMGIDRQQIVETIFHNYITPANAVGLGDAYKSWWNEEAISAGNWVVSNASQANAVLDSLGFKKRVDGIRITPDGEPMEYTLLADPGYSNQTAVAQVISSNLANIGVGVRVSTADQDSWEKITTDRYDMVFFFTGYGVTPYEFYFNLMSPSGKPMFASEKTNQTAGRYMSSAASSLLDQFIQESNPIRQKALMDKIQAIFVEDAPVIPLYPNYWFVQFNTLRFTSFPSIEDPYTQGYPVDILVLLNVRPR